MLFGSIRKLTKGGEGTGVLLAAMGSIGASYFREKERLAHRNLGLNVTARAPRAAVANVIDAGEGLAHFPNGMCRPNDRCTKSHRCRHLGSMAVSLGKGLRFGAFLTMNEALDNPQRFKICMPICSAILVCSNPHREALMVALCALVRKAQAAFPP